MKNDAGVLRRFIPYLKPYRLQITIAFAALIIVILSELLVPVVLKNSIDNYLASGEDSVPAVVQDEDSLQRSVQGLIRESLIIAGLLVTALIASFFQVYLMSYAGQGIMKALRIDLLQHIAAQSLSFLGRNPIGGLVSRITSDVETINELFSSVIMTLIKNFLVMAGVIAVMFFLNVQLAIITLLTLPPVIIITVLFKKRARRAYREVRKQVAAVNSFLSEHISGIKVIQGFAREQKAERQFSEQNGRLLEADFSEMYVFSVFKPLISLLGTVSLAVIIFYGANLSNRSMISLGTLIAYLDLIRKFYRPLQQLSEQFTIMQSAMAGSERIFELLDTDERIPEVSGALTEGSGALTEVFDTKDTAAEKDQQNCPAVEFKDVYFSYRKDEPVLRGISFSARRGETVAIVGYTGSGKTTAANLAARFWDADSGSIRIGGVDTRSIPLAVLRRTVQAVQQDVFLFSGSIRDNISLGRDYSDQQILDAAGISCLRPVLDRLRAEDGCGLDYVLTEGATNLSQGERQLVAFTRVIVHNPPVLILDEATASIDSETEKLIQHGLENLLRERTSIVIAHRLSTVRYADRILVFGKGKIIESGTHEELMSMDGAYRSLYELQFGNTAM